MRKLLIILLIIFLLISPVAASHTIRVDEKKILGVGTCTASGSFICVIGESINGFTDSNCFEEYPISLDDYDKIDIGDTVTLEKEYGFGYYKVV